MITATTTIKGRLNSRSHLATEVDKVRRLAAAAADGYDATGITVTLEAHYSGSFGADPRKDRIDAKVIVRR